MSSVDLPSLMDTDIVDESLLASILDHERNAWETTPSSPHFHVPGVSEFPTSLASPANGNLGTSSRTNGDWSGIYSNWNYTSPVNGNPRTSSGTNGDSSGIYSNSNYTSPANGNPRTSSGTNGDWSGIYSNSNYTSPANGNPRTSSGTNGANSGIDSNSNYTSPASGNSGTFSGTNGASSGIDSNSNYTSPANERQTTTQQLLSSSKHFCCVGGDSSSRKHYAVYTCEDCQVFSVRAARNCRSYTCRKFDNCVTGFQSHKRCQSCRLKKCLSEGRKTDNVQKERVEPTSSGQVKTLLEPVTETEKRLEVPDPVIADNKTEICLAAETELFLLMHWAIHIPLFMMFSLEDRVVLLHSAWNQLLILGIAYRSMSLEQALVFADGLPIISDSAEQVGLRDVFDLVLKLVVRGLRYSDVDETELLCLMSIILFNPDAEGLSKESIPKVISAHDSVKEVMRHHTQSNYPQQRFRYSGILSRLPDLKTASSACEEQLLFNHVINDDDHTTLDDYLNIKLATPADK